MPRDLIVPADCPPMRLDQFVVSNVPGMSRRRVRQLDLRLNRRPAKLAATVQPGDLVSLPDDADLGQLEPNADLTLPLLYRDDALVAVDKPAGMQSVALRPDETDTVANFLLAAFPDVRAAGGPLEGGLVHRLDAGTSGVLLAARTASAHADLRRQFDEHRIHKEYLALVTGNVEAGGSVDTPIAHDPRRQARMVVCADAEMTRRLRGREASTRYEPVLRYGRETLLRVSMRTGVRHQVRVHLASIGHAIVGDALYGSGATHRWVRRQALHASRVTLRHPIGGATLVLESPLPKDFEAALKRLKP